MRLAFGRFELDVDARTLRGDGDPIRVEPQVFDVLAHLIVNRDRLVPQMELLDAVWGTEFVSLSSLTSRIKAARQALDDDGRRQRWIRTERGRGYQFVGQVDERDGTGPARSGSTSTSSRRDLDVLGRGDDLRAVADQLRQPGLVAVVGPGGVGKTTLVRSLARRPDLVDGRNLVVVELDEIDADDDVATAIATALTVDGGTDRSLLEACAEWLEATGQVLVLDNCEHVLAGARSAVDGLLTAAPDLRLLATSRRRLRTNAERLQPLAPLAVPAVGIGLEDARLVDAVQLFCDRARRVVPSFELDATTLGPVAELCRRLDGLPLALELAASRCGVLGLVDLVAGIEERLDLVRDRSRDTSDRHHSLRTTVDWSTRLLPSSAWTLLQALASFPAGLRLTDVAVVVVRLGLDEPADELVAELLDSSLLVRADGTVEARYGMLETIRHHALQRLAEDPGTASAVAELVVDHALHVAAVERQGWLGEGPGPTSPARLRDELPNLRAARQLLTDRGDTVRLARLVSGLAAFTEEACLAELWSWCDLDAASELDAATAAEIAMIGAGAARNRGDLATAIHLGSTARTDGADAWVRGRGAHAEAMARLFSGDPFGATDAWLRMDVELGGVRGHLYAAMCSALVGDVEAAVDALADAPVDPARDPVDLVASRSLVRGEVERAADTGGALDAFGAGVTVAREHGLWYHFGVIQESRVALLAAVGDDLAAAEGYRELILLWLRGSGWTQLWTTLRNVAGFVAERDPGTALLIVEAAHRSPAAAALDDAAIAAETTARAALSAALGDDEAERVLRRAAVTPRAEVARAALATLATAGSASGD